MAANKQFDLFFSYNHDSKDEVKELYQKLKDSHGNSIAIWIDYEQWTAGCDSNQLLMKGLANSKCILCFVTKKYSESVVCKRELAQALDKPRAILMLEHFDKLDGAVQFQIKTESRLNFYWNREGPSLWVGEEYEKLMRTIGPYINTGGQKCVMPFKSLKSN